METLSEMQNDCKTIRKLEEKIGKLFQPAIASTKGGKRKRQKKRQNDNMCLFMRIMTIQLVAQK